MNKIIIPINDETKRLCRGGSTDKFIVKDLSGWEDKGKYDTQTVYFCMKNNPEKIYALETTRWGSYSQGYDYGYDDLQVLEAFEVVREEVTSYIWRYI